jgi:hypothetical protein
MSIIMPSFTMDIDSAGDGVILDLFSALSLILSIAIITTAIIASKTRDTANMVTVGTTVCIGTSASEFTSGGIVDVMDGDVDDWLSVAVELVDDCSSVAVVDWSSVAIEFVDRSSVVV